MIGKFKPEWTRNRYLKQRKAKTIVRKTRDQSQLVNIIRNAPNYYIREKAIKKLSEHSLILDVVRNFNISEAERYNELKKIHMRHDESFFFSYEYEYEDRKIRMMALDKLDDEALVQNECASILHTNGGMICFEAMERLSEQTKLLEIARSKTARVFFRAISLGKVDDNIDFIEFIIKSEDCHVRYAAANRLTDDVLAQEVYADIAKCGKVRDVRLDALNKVTDQSVLLYVAKDLGNPIALRAKAIEKLDGGVDVTIFIAENEHCRVRIAAAKKLSDKKLAQEVFADIVKNTKWIDCRYLALMELNDVALLTNIFPGYDESQLEEIRENHWEHMIGW